MVVIEEYIIIGLSKSQMPHCLPRFDLDEDLVKTKSLLPVAAKQTDVIGGERDGNSDALLRGNVSLCRHRTRAARARQHGAESQLGRRRHCHNTRTPGIHKVRTSIPRRRHATAARIISRTSPLGDAY